MIYTVTRFVFRMIFRLFFGWDVQGREHIPVRGPLLVCANHFSWWDPPAVGAVMTRKVFFMAKHELFRYPVLRTLLPRAGAFPVRRGRPDRGALRRALELLSKEEVVGLFPEGTRRRDGVLGPAEPGAALLAIRAQVPVLPVGIIGPYRMFGSPLRIRIGQPFELKEYYGHSLRASDLAEAGAHIMDRIAALMESGKQEELSAFRRGSRRGSEAAANGNGKP